MMLIKKYQNIDNCSDIKSDLKQYSNYLLNRENIEKMTEYSNNKRISLHKLFNKQINIFLKVLIAILKKLQNNKREYNSN